MSTRTIDLTKGSIAKHIRTIAIPASVGYFFQTMYNVVDTFYAGQISTDALAGMSLSFPVFFIIIAIAAGFNQGISVLIANYLGANEKNKARKIAAQGVSLSFILSIIIMIIGLMFSPLLYEAMNSSGEALNSALEYTNVLFYGAITFVLTMMLGGTLSAQGDTKTLRDTLIIGFFLNLVLNPLFLYGLNISGFQIIPAMGLAGIALATIGTQLAALLYIIYRVSQTDLFTNNWIKKSKPQLTKFLEIAKQGFPASLNMMTVALGFFVINYFLNQFTAAAVASYGIVTRVVQISLMPVIGINIATTSIVSQNNGAKKIKRVKETIIKSIIYGTSIVVVTSVIVFLLREQLISLFIQNVDNKAEILKIANFNLILELLASVAYILLFVAVSAMQALKKPQFGLYLGIVRQFILPAILIPVFINYFNLGLYGIFWAIFVIVWVSAIFATFYLIREVKNLKN